MKLKNNKKASFSLVLILLAIGAAAGVGSIAGISSYDKGTVMATPITNHTEFEMLVQQATAEETDNAEEEPVDSGIAEDEAPDEDYIEPPKPAQEKTQEEKRPERSPPEPAKKPEKSPSRETKEPSDEKEETSFAVLAAASPSSGSSILGIPNQEGFVYVNGTDFYINGKEFYFSGTNNYYVWYGDPDCIAYNPDGGCSREVLDDAARMNLSVIRTWGFADGYNYWGALQPRMGVYEEESFQKMDLLIREASDRNLKLIIPFVNNWNDFGGMFKYTVWCDVNFTTPEETHDKFYTDNCTRQAYKDYIEYFLNRTNTLTGIKYKDDPTIFAWELANEPRAQTDQTGQILDNWIGEMSAFIKSIDSNHMVTTGEEGFYKDNGTGWMYDGNEGTDFIANHNHTTIDFATFHLYPDHWGITKEKSLEWIGEHINDSHSILGKPVILGEFGKKDSARDEYMQEWYGLLESGKANGNLFWELIDYNYPWDPDFGVNYPEDSSTAGIIMDNSNFWKNYNEQLSPSNNPPQIQEINNIVVREGELVTISADAIDADNDFIFYSISDAYHFNKNGTVFTWQTVFGDMGNYTITITASDGISETKETFELTILENPGCMVPVNGMFVTRDAVVCNGSYYLPDGITLDSNVVLECDNSKLYGDSYKNNGITIGGSNSTVKNCVIEWYSRGIQLLQAGNTSIINNTILGGITQGINIQESDSTRILNNTFKFNSDIGVYAYRSTNTIIKNNDFLINGKGIYLDGCLKGEIKDNYFWLSRAGAVYLISNSGNYTITDNYMLSNGNAWLQSGGILLSSSDFNIVKRNLISLSYHGLDIFNSNSNIITDNHINGSNIMGVKIVGGLDNSIKFNNITNNKEGVSVYNSINGLEYNNIYSNDEYNIKINSGNYTAINNWWGTVSCSRINDMIQDCNDNPTYGCLEWNPVLGAPYPDGNPTQCVNSTPPGAIPDLIIEDIDFYKSVDTGEGYSVSEYVAPNGSITYLDIGNHFFAKPVFKNIGNSSTGSRWTYTTYLDGEGIGTSYVGYCYACPTGITITQENGNNLMNLAPGQSIESNYVGAGGAVTNPPESQHNLTIKLNEDRGFEESDYSNNVYSEIIYTS